LGVYFLAKKIEVLLVVPEDMITQDIMAKEREFRFSIDANNSGDFWVRVSELCTDREISGEAATSDISSCTFIEMRRQEGIK
jgi:hypothetical protein